MKNSTFLIKSDNDKECIMRLPTNKYGGLTTKGFKMIRDRFSTPYETYGLKYALNIEAFTNSHNLKEAIIRYDKNLI